MNYTVFAILVVVGMVAIFAYRFIYQRQVIKLQALLYMQNDPDAYLAELESFTSKVLMPDDLRRLLSIDAYLAKDDRNKLNELFDAVENGKIRRGDHFTVLQKEVMFYVKTKQVGKAKEAYEKMEELLPSLKDKDGHYALTLKECEYEIEININHSGKFADELVKKSKEVGNDIAAGVYLYKAAQSYYYKKDEKNMIKCLEKAEVKLRGTSSNQRLKDILKSKKYSELEKPL